MKYNSEDYKKFLQTEIDSQIIGYEETVNTDALVLKARGEVFVGRFMNIHENGSAIFKVRISQGMPRKGSFWTACYLNGEMGSFKNWGQLSWIELRKNHQRQFCECSCQWLSKSEDNDFCIVGIKGLSIEFIEMLDKEHPIIAFGPKDPPLQYLHNLLDIVNSGSDPEAKEMLYYCDAEIKWNPQMISAEDDLVTILRDKLSRSNIAVIQGPPGTGKTYRMAKFSSILLSEGYSVLVTALTNQALIELAKKEDLNEQLAEGLISKTSLTYDERRSLPYLIPVVENKCNACKGHLTLSSFYVSSGWAKEAENKEFDYVIMDEASQAFLPMIAASRILGRKVILIGDQNQLSPITATNDDVIARNKWHDMVCGFRTTCKQFEYPSMMLKDTFRLTQRAARFTGIFYDNQLNSVSKTNSIPSQIPLLEKSGGPVLLTQNMERGTKASENSIKSIIDLVDEIRRENPTAEIAVLSKFKDAIKNIVRGFLTKSSFGISDNLRIDTVDKVQGLTVDYCIYFIPNSSVRFSLCEDLFNVATSRAIYNTIIIADSKIMEENMPDKVRRFLNGICRVN